MNPRILPLLLAGLTAASTAVIGCEPTSAAAPEDDHAGHDHAEPTAAGPDDHGAEDGHDHGAAPEAAGSGHAEDDGHGHGSGGEGEAEGAHADEVRLTEEAVAAYGIRTAPVERRPLEGVVSAPARVGFNEEAMAHVAALLPGRVDTLHAKLGQQVAAGDVLIEVRSPELGRLQADYFSARSAVEAARPAVEIARDNAERARTLLENAGGITQTAVQEREATLAQAQRELTAAEAEVSAAENTLRLNGVSEDTIAEIANTQKVSPVFQVLAPIAGEVVEREVTPGELVGPGMGGGDGPLLVLADLSTVWVGVDVAEARLGRIGVGSVASLTVPALDGRRVEGEVTYVDPRVDAGSRTARLRVEVDNPDGVLRPGMFARAEVGPKEPGRGVPALPVDAVMTVEGEDSVFVPVEGEKNTFARRAVAVGPRVGGFVPLVRGLEEGDEVVISGGFILKADLGKAGAEHAH
ncbi:efflux RND transporter periplasmic adaptor subunit [Phycisphaera mikurensis]|uniref:Cation efflux system periplasmic linker protein n=1 Tax=Phycisphaera mikurensis (strain NBRC 102666 / KCTC 22515 / FYK2301M01) TaxID=1142394 RepID=I0IJH1_PHYMF|nr:efflux RND transporter periplasmic adaptor subunit [Phycisphaera mikurensis]MBB6443159.1 cobalt-zinc-cadmium efflux system membrane fusion protein [Phycisphaera mikurensis]BAM05409.1 cation efflux system periplasmic linker protein [Phycisphaera mikurensis NBRC 102666]